MEHQYQYSRCKNWIERRNGNPLSSKWVLHKSAYKSFTLTSSSCSSWTSIDQLLHHSVSRAEARSATADLKVLLFNICTFHLDHWWCFSSSSNTHFSWVLRIPFSLLALTSLKICSWYAAACFCFCCLVSFCPSGITVVVQCNVFCFITAQALEHLDSTGKSCSAC